MAERYLVNHFPLVPAETSIVDISTGRPFRSGSEGTLASLKRSLVGAGDTYHWSSSIEGHPSWAIRDPATEILHVRAHTCPFSGTPLHPECYDCITEAPVGLDEVDFVFHWKAVPAEEFPRGGTAPRQRPADIDRVVRTADTPILDLFDGFWTSVFGATQFELGPTDALLLQHCGACPNPMDPRLTACATCVKNRAPSAGFPGADYVLFVKMFRPADGVRQRADFPGLHEAQRGEGAPPRFGSPSSPGQTANQPDDTGDTQIFRK